MSNVAERSQAGAQAVFDLTRSALEEMAAADEAFLAEVVVSTPVEHLWRLTVITQPWTSMGLNFAGETIMWSRPAPIVASMIPDILRVPYDSRPNPEIVELRERAIARRGRS